jgi:Domain of Unknown Function with PDB structure (DUF3857)/Transglutaminase-like superfamily
MIRSRLSVGLVSVLALGAAMPALGQEAAPQQQGPAFRLRSIREDITVDAQGRAETTISTAIQLLKLSPTAPPGEMPVPYNATLQDIEIGDAYTQKADGRKLPVDPANILNQHPQSANLAPLYTDMEQKVIIFPNVEAGDTLVYTEKLHDKKTYLPGQYTYMIVPNPVVEIDDAHYSISVPKTFTLHADSKDMDQTVATEGTETVYRWSYVNATPQARATTLVAHPETQAHFAVSTLANYDDFAHSYAGDVKDKIAVTPAIQKEADLLTIGIRDPREQTRAIYDWVSQHVRYVAIELGQGGLIPHDADWTLSNQFGDCKDHALLFASLLKAKNIPAELVLINAHPRFGLTGVPVVNDFDHMIVWLPSFNLYADTTAGTAAFGTLPISDSGKPVVHVVASGAALHQTPLVAPGELTSTYKVHVNFDGQRRAHVEMTTTATGGWATDMRRIGSAMQAMSPDQAGAAILKSHNFPNATGQLIASPSGGLNAEYSISGNFLTGRLNPQGNMMPVANGLRLMNQPGDGPMGPLNNKQLKDSDETPCLSAKQVEDVTVDFTSPYHLEQVPRDAHVKTANLTYDSHWSVSGNTVNVHREFDSHVSQAICTGALRNETAAALAQIRDDYDTPTRVLPAGIQQSAGGTGN